MNDSNMDYDYNDYEYLDDEMTTLGLTTGQLALIIGVNAVIALIISVSVILIINWQATPTTTVVLTTPTGELAPAVEPSVPIDQSALPVNTPETVIYAVQRGDTLSRIAEKFSVPLSDLMLANGLTDEDFIQVGQELIIPVGGLPTATPTFTPVPPTPTEAISFEPPTPLPTETGETVVNQPPPPNMTATVMPSAAPPTQTEAGEVSVRIDEVIGAGYLTQETLIITNQGGRVSLKGWSLEGSSLANFIFPDILLYPGSNIRIHTRAGQNSPSDLYLNQNRGVWPPGTTVVLKDANKNEVSRLTVTSPLN